MDAVSACLVWRGVGGNGWRSVGGAVMVEMEGTVELTEAQACAIIAKHFGEKKQVRVFFNIEPGSSDPREPSYPHVSKVVVRFKTEVEI